RALAPMFIYGNRQVAFIGSGVSDYLGFLAEDSGAAKEIWDGIRSAHERWNTCDFQEIPPVSPMLSVADDLYVERSESSVCPVLSLPETVIEFEARLSPKFRHNLRNARNRLNKIGASFEIPQDPVCMDALFRLHAARWKSKGEDGVLSAPCVQNFLREVCPGM